MKHTILAILATILFACGGPSYEAYTDEKTPEQIRETYVSRADSLEKLINQVTFVPKDTLYIQIESIQDPGQPMQGKDLNVMYVEDTYFRMTDIKRPEETVELKIIGSGTKVLKGNNLTESFSVMFSIPDYMPLGKDNVGTVNLYYYKDPATREVFVSHFTLKNKIYHTPHSKANQLEPVAAKTEELNTSVKEYYKVQRGDTGYEIAHKHGLSFSELKSLNPYLRWNSLSLGEKVRVK